MLNEHPPRKGASSELDRLHVGKMVEGRRGERQVRDAKGEKKRGNGKAMVNTMGTMITMQSIKEYMSHHLEMRIYPS